MIAVHSDAGIKKQINEDALLVKIAQTSLGKVSLGIVCDGLGGLSKGELASAAVIRVFDYWFEHMLPELITKGFNGDELKFQWNNIVLEQNQLLMAHASRSGTRMGTTIVALLIINQEYFIMNVGDSRAYLLYKQLFLLTKDQTFVQHEIDMGRMTREQAQNHPRRNVLLQCIGASDVVTPDYYSGQVFPDTTFVLCSDGFRHMVSSDEIYAYLNPVVASNERTMKQNAVVLTELNKQRMEVDNISVVVIRTCQGEIDDASDRICCRRKVQGSQ